MVGAAQSGEPGGPTRPRNCRPLKWPVISELLAPSGSSCSWQPTQFRDTCSACSSVDVTYHRSEVPADQLRVSQFCPHRIARYPLGIPALRGGIPFARAAAGHARSFTNPQPGPTPGNVKLRPPPRQSRECPIVLAPQNDCHSNRTLGCTVAPTQAAFRGTRACPGRPARPSGPRRCGRGRFRRFAAHALQRGINRGGGGGEHLRRIVHALDRPDGGVQRVEHRLSPSEALPRAIIAARAPSSRAGTSNHGTSVRPLVALAALSSAVASRVP